MIPGDGIGQWRKSSYSGGNGNCLEVAPLAGDGGRAVRDSKAPAGPVLMFSNSQWAALVGLAKGQEAGSDS
ncbi:DUF397 domain-containing protein [Streptomyces sp. DSM 44915]|uniref:DUF397 domain-containing protein n=1 Tax=Streptomyces chisholmiae TaxID=3075540 RepID=A0ABU2K101_9ACTN|nr:DUF397 domain-containing protein [Streptomyces sp. DSM 44915]MDT0270681.1 DUF397 domain-containing protein [Streptomyces sp. DSM 44915]